LGTLGTLDWKLWLPNVVRELSLGTFTWELSFRTFRLGVFVWDLSLGNFRLLSFARELSLGNFRLGHFKFSQEALVGEPLS
jgi:hypothetical protein